MPGKHTWIELEKMIGIFAPYDFNNVNGNALRPIMEAGGIMSNGFDDFTVICNKTNTALGFPQAEMNKGMLSMAPAFMRPKNSKFILDIPIIKKLKLHNEPQILHLHNYYSAWAVPGNSGAKIIMDFHVFKSRDLRNRQLRSNHAVKNFFNKRIMSLVRRTEKKGIGMAEKVIVASPNIKRGLAEEFCLDDSGIEVINNMLDPREFQQNSHDEEFTVGVVGPFNDDLNREVLPVVKRIAKMTDVKIKLAGAIPGEEKASLGRFNNVEAMGRLPGKDYKRFLSSIGCLLLPYPFLYGYGGPKNKLLEAAACGTPIVSTLEGAVGFGEKNALMMGENEGALVRQMEKLREDAQLRKKLGKKLRDFIGQNHNFLKETRKLMKLYGSILS